MQSTTVGNRSAARRQEASSRAEVSSLGTRIRAARTQQGMTLAQLAGEDFSLSFLSLVERGKSRISLRSLEIVARRLELPVSYFLAEEQPAESDVALRLDRAEIELVRAAPRECLRLLDDIDVPERYRIRALRIRGVALLWLGEADAALSVLNDALDLAEKRNEITVIPQLHYDVAQALFALHSFEEAYIFLRRALDDATGLPLEPGLLARALLLAGDLALRRGDRRAAERWHEQAVEALQRMGDLEAVAAWYLEASEMSQRIGYGGEPARLAHIALAAWTALNGRQFAARGLAELALRSRTVGNHERAAEAVSAALKLSRDIRSDDAEALAYAAQAMLSLDDADLDQAAAAAERALALSRDKSGPASWDAMAVLGEVAERHGEPQRADQLYQQVIDEARAGRDVPRFTDACRSYSRLLERRGDVRGALRFARMATDEVNQ